MKNALYKIIFGRDLKLTTLFAIVLLIFVGLGCGSRRSGNSKPIPPEYFGVWTGQDGTLITIRSDGKGDYKAGGTTVDGGTVEIDDAKKELSITFFGIGPSKKIDSPPNGNEMKLDGVVYKRSGSSSMTSTDTKKPVADSSPTKDTTATNNSTTKADASLKEIPQGDEMQELVRATLLQFNDAIQADDFTDFFPTISKIWQRESSPAKLKETFQLFIDRKIDISEISTMKANMTTAPRIENTKGFDEMIVEGNYDTSPTPTRFKLKYTPEGKNWKLTGIMVDNSK